MPPDRAKQLFEDLHKAPDNPEEAERIALRAAEQEAAIQDEPAATPDAKRAHTMEEGLNLPKEPKLDHRRAWEQERE